MQKWLVALGLSISSAPLTANEISVGLSDSTAQAQYVSYYNSKVMYDVTLTHHEDDGNLVEAGFYGRSRVKDVDINLGGRLFWVELDDTSGRDGQGFSIGGKASWRASDMVRLEGYGFYAPSVTSYKDIDHFRHFGIQLRITALENTHIILGYRDIEADVQRFSDQVLHEGGYAGFSILF